MKIWEATWHKMDGGFREISLIKDEDGGYYIKANNNDLKFQIALDPSELLEMFEKMKSESFQIELKKIKDDL